VKKENNDTKEKCYCCEKRYQPPKLVPFPPKHCDLLEMEKLVGEIQLATFGFNQPEEWPVYRNY
jgi:hypothetical protein